jgi:hypothetical protein
MPAHLTMARKWWQPWTWFQQQHSGPGLRVVVYTRANCHLCEEAAEFFRREQSRGRFEVEWIDVDQNEDLKALHGDWVPVVEINGKVRFRGGINPILWDRMMRALAHRD